MSTVPLVTASNLRVVRRRNHGPQGALTAALTAASTPVTDPTKIFTSSTGRRDSWQDEAWRFTKCVSELGYFVRWRSNACAQVRLVASAIDPETGLPTGSIDEKDEEGKQFVELVKQIAGGPLGQKRLIKRAAACLTVPGELTICILQRDDGEKWYAVGKKQIKPSQTKPDSVAIKLPDGTLHEFDKDNDAMFRVWNEDAEDPCEADSPVRACLEPLGEIERASKKIKNADKSRLLNNGLLMVPSEASLPDNQAPVAADQPGTTQPPTPAQSRRVAQSLQRMIVQAAEASVRDENSVAAVLPMVAAAPGDHLGKVVHIEFSKEATKSAVDIRDNAIVRVARGLDMSPERLLGMGSNSNHWSAYLLADEDVKLHVTPVMEVLCQAMYEHTLSNLLEAQGIDSTKYTLWFDASHLTKDPDLTDEFKTAYQSGTIQSPAFVEGVGLPERALYDFTTDEGKAQWARDRVSADPNLLPMLGQMIPEFADYDFGTTSAAPGPAVDDYGNPIPTDQPDAATTDPYTDQQQTTDQQTSTTDVQEPDTETNDPTTPTYSLESLARARADTVARTVEELLANRALELANKRRISTSDRALHARLRHVPVHERHRHLPAVTPAEVQRLIRGWDDILTPEFAAARGLNYNRLHAAVSARVTAELTCGQVNAHATNASTTTSSTTASLGVSL